MKWTTTGRRLVATAIIAPLLAAPALGASFLDVGKQAPINVLINASPWYDGFQAVVALYEKQTGNKVNLEVTPFPGMLEKARNAVRAGGTSPLDLLNIDSQNVVEFYAGGFLEPLKEIDPSFALPKEVLTLDDAGCWDAKKQFRTCSTGKLMGYAPNGNIELFYYRKDVYDKLHLKVPKTFDDVLANCKVLQKPPKSYGYVVRGQKGDSIFYDMNAFMLAYGAKYVKDAENGDFTVEINSPQALAALKKYIQIQKACGPANAGSLGQGDLIQLVQTGKGLQAQAVIAAFPNFDNPRKSAVVDKMNAAVLPAATPGGKPGVAIGSWVFAIPKNASEAGKKGAIAFSKWFLTYKAQYAYAEAGGIPVRTDVFSSDLKNKEKYRWMTAYLDEIKYGKQILGFKEGPAINQMLGLRYNQALVGELSPAAALNKGAQDMYDLFKKDGRKTGMLPPLPE
ncbi:ABC transporter substrate-binding protein [Solirhodobacter olei]|uniref:ABC transporter substrate-binding protein n=1 Tax=Solirhodobacter olei TaxID=2493082 RepID=UPI0013E4046B|nr:extracellular solute-binding protein [Solirhodobacter olei]